MSHSECHSSEQHAHHHHGGNNPLVTSAQATLHCLTGCVIGEVAGSVSERELLSAMYEGRATLTDPVSQHMETPLPLLGSGESLDDAQALLSANDAVMVIEDGKPLVLQGDRGLSQKSEAVGNASIYYSMTRLPIRGALVVDGVRHEVAGLGWIDREWSTSALGPEPSEMVTSPVRSWIAAMRLAVMSSHSTARAPASSSRRKSSSSPVASSAVWPIVRTPP